MWHCACGMGVPEKKNIKVTRHETRLQSAQFKRDFDVQGLVMPFRHHIEFSLPF